MQVSISQFLASYLTVEEASDFIMEFNSHHHDRGEENVNEYFRNDLKEPHEYILCAFPWISSIRGMFYWQSVCNRLRGFNPNAVTFSELCDMLEPIDRHRLSNEIIKQRGEELLDEMLDDVEFRTLPTDWLSGLFDWVESEQGGDYWSKVYHKFEFQQKLNRADVLN
jgi:hypothetical protein